MQTYDADPAIIGFDVNRSPRLHKDRHGDAYIDRADFLALAENVADDFDSLCVIEDGKPRPVLFVDNGFFDAAFDDGDEEGIAHPFPHLPVIKHFGLDTHDYTCIHSREFLEACTFCYFDKETDDEYLFVFAVRNKADGQAVAEYYCPSAIRVPILDGHLELV